ncbi:DUF1905 domain-containing protein [Methylophilus sp. 14]|uniref:DUF1905 domain-containing protein n=1 Tax=Methylophilus sp. 14 TaxID=2781019 RepID=UPI00188DCB33|nr:DUF1905 domain-containing protein [Methylophilus sp. 14]MBF4988141.1 DUF1905 domain-containing protein [Methylophilus sp. 14]
MTIHFPITIQAVLQLTDPRLPVFVVIPFYIVEAWNQTGSNIVEVIIDGYETGRKTLKKIGSSDQSDWFVELTLPFCRIANIKVGDTLDVSIKVATNEFASDVIG